MEINLLIDNMFIKIDNLKDIIIKNKIILNQIYLHITTLCLTVYPIIKGEVNEIKIKQTGVTWSSAYPTGTARGIPNRDICPPSRTVILHNTN